MVYTQTPASVKEIFKFYGIPFDRYKRMGNNEIAKLIHKYYHDTSKHSIVI